MNYFLFRLKTNITFRHGYLIISIIITVILFLASFHCKRENIDFSYDDHGIIIREDYRNDKGTLLHSRFYENKTISHIIYYQQHNRIDFELYYYPNGNIKSYQVYTEDGLPSYYYEYDEKEQLIREEIFNKTGKSWYYKLYEYNSENQLVQKSNYNGLDHLQGYLSYSYNSENERIGTTFYDHNDHKIKEFLVDSNSGTIEFTEYSSDQQPTIRYHYNDQTGKVVYDFQTPDDHREGVELSDNNQVMIVKHYDDNDNFTHQISYDSGKLTEQVNYYKNGNRKSLIKYDGYEQMTQNFIYDISGNLKKVVRYEYNKQGNIAQIRTYDSDGNLITFR